MMRLLPLVVAGGLLLIAGFWQGVWTDRWVPSYDAKEALDRLAKLPTGLDDWDSSPVSAEADDLRWSNDQAPFLRRYVHRPTGRSIVAGIWHGPTGYMVVHTPVTCYPEIGYRVEGQSTSPVELVGADQKPAEFHSADFVRQNGAITSRLRIHWAWSGDGTWSVPERPRLSMVRHRAVYKLYVLRENPEANEASPDLAVTFLQAFLPHANETLFKN